jgi:hypothetical protein
MHESISYQQALVNAKQLLKYGDLLKSKQIVWTLLQHKPSDKQAFDILSSIAAKQGNKFTNKSESFFLNIYKEYSQQSIQKALSGWVYSLSIDKYFLSPVSNPPHPKKYDKTLEKSTTGEGKDNCDANIFFNALLTEQNIRRRWQGLQIRQNANDKLLIQDSFSNYVGKQLDKALIKSLSSQNLNVCILGAGCAGLLLASSLKIALGEKIDILVIEVRSQTQHYKKPYSRKWLTNLSMESFSGLVEGSVYRLLDDFGRKNFAGTSIASLESLLLASCKNMGVKFLFDSDYSLKFIKDSKAQLIFDATGGKRSSLKGSEKSAGEYNKQRCVKKFPLPSFQGFAQSFKAFGVTDTETNYPKEISVLFDESTAYPIHCGKRLATHMVKLVGIPTQIQPDILSWIAHNNDNNRFYLWPGNLHEEINELLLFINLSENEHAAIKDVITYATPLNSAVAKLSALSELDLRIFELFSILLNKSPDALTKIESPFTYSPYITHLQDGFDRIYGRAVIPLGDSLFNGHPKVGNGLGSHIVAVRFIQQSLMFSIGQ